MALEFIKLLEDRFGNKVLETHAFRGDETAVVRMDAWVSVMQFLKSECGLDMFLDLCAVDFPDRPERFELVAHLYSTEKAKRLRVKTRCSEKDPSIQSLVKVFSAANWFEREVFDLFGITFEGHPNLKRLLCHQGFEGHALRKDYPKDKRGAIPVPDTLKDEMEKFQIPNSKFQTKTKFQ
ncbi:MAG: NADH-quinone oxidoreductase subunit C [Pseudomonadota bacterium]